MSLVIERQEEVGTVQYSVSRKGSGYEVVVYTPASGSTAKYQGALHAWIRLSSGYAPCAASDEMIAKLQDVVSEYETRVTA